MRDKMKTFSMAGLAMLTTILFVSSLSTAYAQESKDYRNCVENCSELYDCIQNCTTLLNLTVSEPRDSKLTKLDAELCYCDGNSYLSGRFACVKGNLYQCSDGSWINVYEMCRPPPHPNLPYEPPRLDI
jgi:hypothetical protein